MCIRDRFRDSVNELIDLARSGNKYLADKEPWKLYKENNISEVEQILYISLENCALLSILSEPFIPNSAKKIREISLRYGAQVPFIRPKRFSTDKASSVSALKHAVNFMEKQNKCKYDIIVELMCTNPLKDCNDIDLCISKIVNKKADSVIAMHELTDHHPIRIKKIINEKIYDFNFTHNCSIKNRCSLVFIF